MATPLEVIASELLKSAIDAEKLFGKTKDQSYKDKAVRLRRIVVNLQELTIGTSSVATLNDLTDVTISAPANAQVLTYNSTTGQWENQTPAAGGGGNMNTSTYDVDNDGIVDGSETTQIIVRNSTGSTLTKGQVVYLSGATGNRPNALLSQADTEATSSKTIGIVIANIANNSDGYVAVNGTLHDLDTSAFTAGDAVWLSATVAGGMTSTIPAEPNHTVFIGYVARSHPTQGRLVIVIQNGYELNELHGVLISSEANNDLLVYESATSLWKNKTFSAIFGGTPLVSVPTLAQVTTAGNTTTNAITVGGLTVNTTANSGGIILQQNGTNIGEFRRVGNNNRGALYLINSGTTEILLETGGFSYIRSNGLGIGTATDAGYKLDVNGTARFSGNTYLAGDILVSNGAGTRYIQASNGSIGFLSSNSSGYNLWTDNSKVGIKSELYISNDLNYNIGIRLRTSTTQTSPSGYGYELSFQPQVNHVPTHTAIRTLDSTYGGNSTITPSPIYIFGGQNTTSGRYADLILQSDFTTGRGNVAVGTTTALAKFTVAGSITAASALAQGVYFNNTLVAAANNDVLVGLDINPTFTNGAFTGLTGYGVRVRASLNTINQTDYVASFENTHPLYGNGIQIIGAGDKGSARLLLRAGNNDGTDAFRVSGAGSIFVGTGNNANRGTVIDNNSISLGGYQTISNGNSIGIVFSPYSAANAVTFRQTGNVLIGTTTDAGYKLDVNGTARFSGFTTVSATTLVNGDAGLTVQSTTNNSVIGQLYGINNIVTASTNVSNISGINSAVNTSSSASLMAAVQGQVNISANTLTEGKGFTTNPAATGTGTFTRYIGFDNLAVFTAGSGSVGTQIFLRSQYLNVASNNIGLLLQDAAAATVVGNWAIHDQTGYGSYFKGSIGIGTTSLYSDTKLKVKGVDSNLIFLVSGVNYGVRIGANAVGGFISGVDQTGFGSDQALNFRATKYQIDLGNFLIGTSTDAGFKLDVNGTARVKTDLKIETGTGGLTIEGDASGYPTLSINTLRSGVDRRNWKFATEQVNVGDFIFYRSSTGGGAANTVVYAVSKDGNFGLGTPTPSYPFHISSAAAANIYGTVQSTNANGTAAWVAFNDQSDNVVYRVFGSGASGTQMGIALARTASLIANLGGSGKFLIGTYSGTDLVFGTSDTARLKLVDSTGNFLVGTMTDLGNKLEVSGTINSTGYKINNTAGYTGILNIVTNPPGMQNIDIQSGIIVNIF